MTEQYRKTGSIPKLTELEIAQFWERVKRGGPSECWLWDGFTQNRYGVLFWKSNAYYAHRIAYWLAIGPFDTDLTIDHVWDRGCRSKLCCNPAHLEPVTQSENIRRWHRSRKLLPGYDPNKCKRGHVREKGKPCWKCGSEAVARSMAKKPEKYAEMKRLQKQKERARQKSIS